MSHEFAEIMFTDSVKAAQEQYGSRARLQRFTENAGPNDELTQREAGFIALRDTFYLASVNEDRPFDLRTVDGFCLRSIFGVAEKLPGAAHTKIF